MPAERLSSAGATRVASDSLLRPYNSGEKQARVSRSSGRSSGRLSRSDDFARVYRSGRSVANRYLVLYYFERSDSGPGQAGAAVGPRVGFSVSKRLGGAVDRNRIKRVLREAFRAHKDSLKRDMDFVLIARTPLVELLDAGGAKAVEEKMIEVLGKAALISPGEERRLSS